MDSKVQIVVDSTAYLTKEWLADYPFVHVVPLTVHCRDIVLEDWLDNNERFNEELKKLRRNDTIPTTSQPSPGQFVETFKPLIEQGYEIVTITISAKLSGTMESARSAANTVGKDKIGLVDSRSTAVGLNALVEHAVKQVEEGKSKDEIVAYLEEKRKKLKVLLLPEGLEYLRRGGRIGGARAILGTVLDIKPLLQITDEGSIDIFQKVRTAKKAYKRMVEEVPENSPQAKIAHFGAFDVAENLRNMLTEKVKGDIEICSLGPVVTTHVGPGVLGLFFEYP